MNREIQFCVPQTYLIMQLLHVQYLSLEGKLTRHVRKASSEQRVSSLEAFHTCCAKFHGSFATSDIRWNVKHPVDPGTPY